jgi:hypothetical protein
MKIASLVVISVVTGLLLPAAASASGPGISPATAQTRIEFNLKVVIPSLISAAQENLRIARQVGGPHGIAEAERDLKAVKTGFDVDNASCLGVRRAPGGFTSFTCKLLISLDALAFTGKVRGSYTRMAGGTWRWQSPSSSVSGGPSWAWDVRG